MLNLYNKIRVKIRETERDILSAISGRPYSRRISIFRPKLLILNIKLFLWEVSINFIKLLVILFRDPGTSFDLFFRQGDPNFGRYSYCDFKIVHKKIKLFSLAGASAIIMVAIATSLLMNLILGTWSLTKAATYYFTQASWTGGVVANSTACTTLNGTWTGTTCVALHSNHQSGWTSYASKDAGVTAGTNLTVTLDTTPDWNQPTDTAFTTFDDPNTDDETSLSIVSGSITLLKPNTAACGGDSECESGTCCGDTSVCGTPGCDCAFTCETCSVTHEGITYQTVSALDGKCWLKSNLGTSNVATAYNDSSAYGWYYQWGRGTDGHQISTSGTTAANATSDTPGHGNFITEGSSPYDWRVPQNKNLWGSAGGYINNPCPTSWHVPTIEEWSAVASAEGITNIVLGASSNLKLAAGGYRETDGSFNHVGSWGHYFSTSFTSNPDVGVDQVRWWTTGGGPGTFTYHVHGLPIRCIKN